jgi:hypothetical protein
MKKGMLSYKALKEEWVSKFIPQPLLIYMHSLLPLIPVLESLADPFYVGETENIEKYIKIDRAPGTDGLFKIGI